MTNTKGINFIKWDANFIFLILLIFGLILIIISPTIIRQLNGVGLLGQESYLNYRLANLIKENRGIPNYDDLSFGGRYFIYAVGWPVFLVLFSTLTKLSLENTSIILPIFFGLMNIIMFYLILKNLLLRRLQVYASSFFLLLSPAFLYLGSASSATVFIIFLLFLGFYLQLTSKPINLAISFICFILIPLFSYSQGILISILLLLYGLLINRKRLKFLILTIFVISLIYIFYYINYGGFEQIKFNVTENFSVVNYFAEFGSDYGIGIFSAFLAVVGLIKMKTNKLFKVYLILLSIILLILIKYLTWPIFYFNFVICILAGYGLVVLLRFKWESKLIKKTTIAVILFGTFASTFLYISRAESFEPNIYLIEGMKYLAEEGEPYQTVFSHYDLGYYINFVGMRNIFDRYFLYAPKPNKRYADSRAFIYAEDLETINQFLKDYSIDYIFIDKKRYNELYKDKMVNRYLPFYLDIDKRFRLVYKNEEVYLWRVYSIDD